MISRPFLLLTFFAVFVLVSMTACMITTQGQSSGEMKRNLQNSFLFKSANIFYPYGVPADPNQLPSLQKEQTKEIDKFLHEFLNIIAGIHKEHANRISNIIGRPIAREIKTNLVLMNTGKPIAFIDSVGDVNIDVKIMQAMYRTALVSGLRDSGISNDGQKPRDERETIEQFLLFKKRVDTSVGRSMFDDMSDPKGGTFEGNWYVMSDLSEKASIVEQHYYGTVSFLLAHEFGHGVLGHLEAQRRLKSTDCDAFHSMETEADCYALLLLYLNAHKMGTTAFGWGGPDLLRSLGFDDFFEYTFNFSNFKTGSVCTHPASKERLQRITKFYKLLLDATWNSFRERIRDVTPEQ